MQPLSYLHITVFLTSSQGLQKSKKTKFQGLMGKKIEASPRNIKKQKLGRGHTILSPSYLLKAEYQTPHKLNAQMGF